MQFARRTDDQVKRAVDRDGPEWWPRLIGTHPSQLDMTLRDLLALENKGIEE
jgi:hypothetical protein